MKEDLRIKGSPVPVKVWEHVVGLAEDAMRSSGKYTDEMLSKYMLIRPEMAPSTIALVGRNTVVKGVVISQHNATIFRFIAEMLATGDNTMLTQTSPRGHDA